MDHTEAINQIKELINSDIDDETKLLRIRLISLNQPKDRKNRYSLKEIEHQITYISGTNIEEINKADRRSHIVTYRQMAHYKSVNLTIATLESIGSHFGNKDHSTVLHSKKTIQNRLDTDKRFREQYETFLTT